MKNRNALIIIAKYPETGFVKTRLNGFMPADKILELYKSMLEQTIHKLRELSGVDTYIAYEPEHAEEYFSRFGTGLVPLSSHDLGLNMSHSFDVIFRKGYQKAVLVGADIPDLSPSIILHAIGLLNDNDLVYGPAEDGGYYLVGMKKLIKEVFENVTWSSDETLSKSLEQARKSGCTVGFTKTLKDIDTIEDVKKAGFTV
ncbi:MAG: TIGR04282 family arsenosugar biosynthesis glycosyltransferase [Nitrospirae bacterium]|nr:TIGR04282 family arsenosugar biosynthesis glycosyltransferase [Nitrospirota bacterium]